jgi:hypothetical protein
MLRRSFMARPSLANLRFGLLNKGLLLFYLQPYLQRFHAVRGQGPWSHWHAISTSSDPASLQG